MKIQKNNFETESFEIKEYKSKYRLVAEEIYQILGKGNYQNVYNCMTRFRAKIADRTIVDLEKIKKISLVKGVQWNGSELQIIIGGEVVKVVDEFKKYEEELLKPKIDSPSPKTEIQLKEKISVGRKIMGAISGIIGPSIPALMAGALMGAIYALLTLPDGNNVLTTAIQTGVNDQGQPIMTKINMGTLYLFDIGSALFFVLKSVILNCIGLFFIYNTTRYFKGNPIFAIAVGLTMVSRGFFPPSMGVDFSQATFGDWTGNMGKSGFLLFKLGEYPILVGGYEGTMIPYVVGGILISYLDRWIKTWMPTTVDIVFRGALIYLISMFSLWFLLAPIAGLIEYGMIYGTQTVGNIPYGFGTALFAFIWQPLVLTGVHGAVATPMSISLSKEIPTIGLAAFQAGIWGQIGAAIGVAIITKNSNLRRVALGSIPGSIFGITEPIVYGINLPKVRPFFMGCFAGAIGGFLTGILNTTGVRLGGQGIFSILMFDFFDIWKVVLIWLITISLGIIFSILSYSERRNELTYFKKSIHKLMKFNNGDKTFIQEFEVYEKTIKDLKSDYKKVDKYYSDLSKSENQLVSLEKKESKNREKMYKKLLKLQSKLFKKKDETLVKKFRNLNDKYSSYSLDNEKEKSQKQINQLNATTKELIDNLNQQKENIYQKSSTIVTQQKLDETQNLIVTNMMWNALNSVEIGYGIEDAKPVKFKKEVK